MIVLLGAAISPGTAAPLYEYTFDSGTGANTGSDAGSGALAVANSGTGGVAFSGTGGVSGGALNLTGGQTYNTSNGGDAAATLSGLGTMSQLTITMWVNFSATALTTNARLFVLGASDVGAANSVGLALNGAGQLNLYLNGGTTANTINLGPTLTANTWYFISLTYDGSSTGSTNSTIQQAATANANSLNGQLYVGTATGAVSDTSVKVGLTSPNYNDTRGAIALGSSTTLTLGNRTDLTRGLNGLIDDASIYDSVLTQSQLDAIRTAAVPEPSASALLGLTLAGAAALFLRRRSACLAK